MKMYGLAACYLRLSKTREEIIKLFARTCIGTIHAKNISRRTCKSSNIGCGLGKEESR